MEDAVKLSTQMRQLSLFSWCLCGQALSGQWKTSSIGKLSLTHRILALSLVKVSIYASEFIVSPLDKKSTRKNSWQNFMRQGYMLSFNGRTLLLREMVTMLRSRDVIYKEPAPFWCMIYVPVLVIIPMPKKKAFLTHFCS